MSYENVDEMTDEATYGVSWGSVQGYTGRLGFLCQPNGSWLSVSYTPPDDARYFGDEAELTYRVDDDTPITETWRVGTDGEQLSTSSGDEFVNRIMDAERLLIRTTTNFPGTSTETTDIPLEHFGTAWAWLTEKCGR